MEWARRVLFGFDDLDDRIALALALHIPRACGRAFKISLDRTCTALHLIHTLARTNLHVGSWIT